MINNDSFSDNPFINSARNALTPEQVEEYKKIGEYMYNDNNFKQISQGSAIKTSTTVDYLATATEALKSGLDPQDLSKEETRALLEIYGERWYEKFDISEEQVKKNLDISNLNLSRQQRRFYERKVKKEKAKRR